MKAVLVTEPFKLEIADVPKPEIVNDDDVLVKVVAGGICGSDVGIYRGTNSLAKYPAIIGHEFGGVVEAVGKGVTKVKVGDMVAVDPVRYCGHCYACTHGRHNVCQTLEVCGVHRQGGFAEYALAPEEACYLYDTTKCDGKYVGMVEPFSIGCQVSHRADIHDGDIVLVMGSGPIGATVMQFAKMKGAATVIMTDILDERLARMKEMGADIVVNVTKEDLKQVVMDATNNEGVTVTVDSVCSVDSFPQALDLTCPAGRVVTLGTGNKPSAISEVMFTKKELTVVGSRVNNFRFPEVIEAFETGKVNPEKLMTHCFHFTKAQDAFDFMKDHQAEVCKVGLSFE